MSSCIRAGGSSFHRGGIAGLGRGSRWGLDWWGGRKRPRGHGHHQVLQWEDGKFFLSVLLGFGLTSLLTWTCNSCKPCRDEMLSWLSIKATLLKKGRLYRFQIWPLIFQVTAKASHVHAKDPEESPCGVDDMTKLAYLHEPGVLQNLKARYDMNEIYVS
jgi:hypothetical protein